MADLDFFKNIQDWNCDLIYNNPGVKAVRPDLAEKCHKGAELVTNEAKDLVNNPAGYVAKKIADGTFNEILSSFWEGTVGVYRQFVTSWLHAWHPLGGHQDRLESARRRCALRLRKLGAAHRRLWSGRLRLLAVAHRQ